MGRSGQTSNLERWGVVPSMLVVCSVMGCGAAFEAASQDGDSGVETHVTLPEAGGELESSADDVASSSDRYVGITPDVVTPRD